MFVKIEGAGGVVPEMSMGELRRDLLSSLDSLRLFVESRIGLVERFRVGVDEVGQDLKVKRVVIPCRVVNTKESLERFLLALEKAADERSAGTSLSTNGLKILDFMKPKLSWLCLVVVTTSNEDLDPVLQAAIQDEDVISKGHLLLSRLDPAALKRYLTELTDQLIGSVEAAFAQNNFFDNDD